MKTLHQKLILGIISLCIISCSTTWMKLANLTVGATRNIDSKTEYKELRRYVTGLDNGQKITATQGNIKTTVHNGKLTAAIEDAVRSVPGGEFMKNVEVYVSDGKYKVIGDVWGLVTEISNKNPYGYSIDVGDKVMYKYNSEFIKGEAIAVEPKEVVVKYFDSKGREQIVKKSYDKLTKYNPDKDEEIHSKDITFSEGESVMFKKAGTTEYITGKVVGNKGDYVLIKYIDQNRGEKIKEILKEKVTKIK